MQPSTMSGRRARLALLPFSWIIAFAITALVVLALAAAQQLPVTDLFQKKGLWPLAVVLPALAFGKVFGLLSLNFIAYATPLRQLFEKESSTTNRNDFTSSNLTLVRVATVLFIFMSIGIAAFVAFAR